MTTKNDKAKKVTTREYMMKLIYQANVNKEEINTLGDKIDEFIASNSEYIVNRYEELRLQYSNDPNMELKNVDTDKAIDKEYIKLVIEQLSENKDMINELINKYAKNWSVNRMPKVDLAILQLAICEILFIDSIPGKVSVNEAVELAKMYCDEKSPKFLNGILGSVINEISER